VPLNSQRSHWRPEKVISLLQCWLRSSSRQQHFTAQAAVCKGKIFLRAQNQAQAEDPLLSLPPASISSLETDKSI